MNNVDKSNIKINIKAIKRYNRINGKLVENKWKPEPKWENMYKKINYKGNPLDNTIQTKIHHIYNSLTPELQSEWLDKTSGLGWSDDYIKIALTFWDKQGEYHKTDKEMVDEYMLTLTDEEKDNFKDICEVFCPDNPHVHIKSSFGFIEYSDNKNKIKDYMKNVKLEEKEYIQNLIDDMDWNNEYHFMVKYIKIQDILNKYIGNISEYEYLNKKIKKLDWNDKLKFLSDYDKVIQYWKQYRDKMNADSKKEKNLTNEIFMTKYNDMKQLEEFLEDKTFTIKKKQLNDLENIINYLNSLNPKDFKELVEDTKDLTIIEKYDNIMSSDEYTKFHDKN